MKFFIILLLCISTKVFATDFEEDKKEITPFPWELVIDRGKINGCIYDNKFYSNGSILIEETLPRKCRIDANRDGYWSELDERELELFEESMKAQLALEGELIGGKPITKYEAAIVRLMRKSARLTSK